jgi:hypothetical protein
MIFIGYLDAKESMLATTKEFKILHYFSSTIVCQYSFHQKHWLQIFLLPNTNEI